MKSLQRLRMVGQRPRHPPATPHPSGIACANRPVPDPLLTRAGRGPCGGWGGCFPLLLATRGTTGAGRELSWSSAGAQRAGVSRALAAFCSSAW